MASIPRLPSDPAASRIQPNLVGRQPHPTEPCRPPAASNRTSSLASSACSTALAWPRQGRAAGQPCRQAGAVDGMRSADSTRLAPVTRGCVGAAVAALLLCVGPVFGHAQVFLSDEPHPEFAIGPLFIVGTVRPDLGPVAVRV